MKKVHPLQRAWAAGIFEGRCMWPKTGLILKVESVERPMMERFHEIVQVGTLLQREKKGCPRPIWMWRTNAMDDTRTALLFLSPFLSGLRVKMGAELIAKIERNGNWIKANPEKATSSVIISPAPTVGQTTT